MQFLSKMVEGQLAVLVAGLIGVSLMAGCASSAPSGATATPAFSPAGGIYNTSQTVTITDATSGAVLYCTTDGTMPTTSSPVCSQPTSVFKTEFLQAIAVAPGMPQSEVAAAGYTINLAAAATPTFSPVGGLYTSTQTVTIQDATAGANIFYTTDGTTPTTSSTVYTGPITVSHSQTISAIAAASGFSSSGVATTAFVINPLATAPTFSPAGGTYTSAQMVTINDTTPGAAIYYTTDGTIPTATSMPYTGPVSISQSGVLSAIAVATGYTTSSVSSAAYVITPPVATPTFTPGEGTFTSVQTVTINDATPGASIYYTTDSTTPTTGSTLYTGPISVSSTKTIKAIGAATGFTPSAVATGVFTINLPPTATPTISPNGGTFTTPQTVTISDTTTGASIFYTVDGTAPTPGSTAYTAPFIVSSTETIKAIAVAPGDSNSAVASAGFSFAIGSSTLNGLVYSGALTPVKGAVVQLYAAGQTGYGSAPTPLVGATVQTTSSGAFTFTYNCPAAPGDLVYLVATGGDTGAGANTNLGMMVALGSCSTLTATTPIVVNEATTIASVYAMAKFGAVTSGGGIQFGTSGTNGLGLSHAMKTVTNLVSIANGSVLTITPGYASFGNAPGTMLNSSYVPTARIDTLANMLNLCVNSNGVGGGCMNLFSATTPNGGTLPVDTLQAALNIALNPGSSASTLYGLASPAGPFLPTLSAAPTDWTLALTFEGAGLGTPAGEDPGDNPTPNSLAIDANGNIWLLAGQACLDPNTYISNGAMYEFDNLGNGVSPASTAANAYCGGYQPQFNGSPVFPVGASAPAGMAIDLNGYVWIGANLSQGFNSYPFAKIASDGTVQGFYGSSDSSICGIPLALAVDGQNNLWSGCTTGSLSGGAFAENNATDGSGISVQAMDGSNNIQPLSSLSLDPIGNLWAVGNMYDSSLANLYQVGTTTNPPVVTNDFSTSGQTFITSVLADGVGNVFSVSNTPGSISALVSNQSTVTSFPYPLPAAFASTTSVQTLALDGDGNIWGAVFSDDPNTGDAQVPSYLVEMTNTGTILSPSGTNVYGYTGTGGGGETQPILADHGFIPAFGGMAVDGSGNLWVVNTYLPYTSFDTAVLPGEQLVEFIGIAGPVATPTSVALKNSSLGVRP